MLKRSRSGTYIIAIACSIPAIMVADLILERIGGTFNNLRADPSVWGTYGDWAAAIIPTLAILITIKMWADDRIDTIKSATYLNPNVELERHGNWMLLNNSGHPLTEICWKGQDKYHSILENGKAQELDTPSEIQPLEIHFTISGVRYKVQPGTNPIPLDPNWKP
ncbi:MAG: hypothetical protein QM708_10045 [Propioniciclava sp.]|uniref:hypothetical protein n=1 Tax=Propioniciclava sp. TaxID=2038686 RepID=UPI0039E51C6E